MLSWKQRRWYRGMWAGLLISCMAATGCAGFDLWGPGFDDTFDWGGTLRAPIQGDSAVGASTKARQIEKNLGFQ